MKQMEKEKAIQLTLKVCVHLYMEIDEVFDGSVLIKQARQGQVFLLLKCMATLSGISDEQAYNMFMRMLEKEVQEYKKESRVYDGEDIIKQIFDEEES